MTRLALALLAALLLAPAAALAGPLGVAPPLRFYDFRPDCTTVTGGPAEVLTGFREGPPELVRATRAGLERGTVLDFGAAGARCAVGATSAGGGASVVVCCDDAAVFAATFRDPGRPGATPPSSRRARSGCRASRGPRYPSAAMPPSR